MDVFDKRVTQNKPVETEGSAHIDGGFNVQVSRITSRDLTYLKIKGAFKIKVENKGDVEITFFENYHLPSYASEVFETGDSNSKFSDHAKIQYEDQSPGENIDIHLTAYFK